MIINKAVIYNIMKYFYYFSPCILFVVFVIWESYYDAKCSQSYFVNSGMAHVSNTAQTSNPVICLYSVVDI